VTAPVAEAAPGATPIRPVRVALVLGLWLGGLAGLAELALLGLRRAGGELVFVPEFFWALAPAVNAALVAAASVLIVAAAPARRPGVRERAAVAAPVALAAAAVLLLPGRLHGLAVALLAAGVGIQAARWLHRRLAPLRRAALVTLPLVLVAAPAGATALLRARHAAPPAPAGAPAAGLPHVLLIVLDTVRAIELSLHGADEATTPAIDRFAAGGAVFDRAMATAPWTLPSHASLLTGRWSHELGADYDRPLADGVPTLAATLAAMGYATAGFVANPEYTTVETGLARGFAHFEDLPLTPGRLAFLTRLSRPVARAVRAALGTPPDIPNRIGGAAINRRVLRWLPAAPDRPLFLFLNYYDAHAPYFPSAAAWRRFVGAGDPFPVDIPLRDRWDPDSAALRRRAYRGALADLDGHVGALLDSLRARGLLENTLVIITSDHGEEFNEHGVMGHGNSLYAAGVHVPLAMVWPGRVPAGCRVGAPVSLRDVPATVLDLLAAAPALPGASLARHWRAPAPPGSEVLHSAVTRSRNLPDSYPVNHGAIASALWWPWRLVAPEPAAGRPELFDHRTDPMEQTDLSGEPWAPALMRALADSLASAGALPAPVTLPPAAAPAPDAAAPPAGCTPTGGREARP
jgi:arylsulfatase A-like enzyme